MAKNKLTNRNPPTLRKDPRVMKLDFDEYFPGRITKTSKFRKVVQVIWSKLTQKQLSLFKNDIFGHFMDLESYTFNGIIIHNLLLRQVAHEETDEDWLWF